MSNFKYNQDDWNHLWASSEAMNRAWQAIDTGNVAQLKDCFRQYPKIHRWIRFDGFDFLDCFAVAACPAAAMLNFMQSTPMFDSTEDTCVDFSKSLLQLCESGGTLKAARMFLKHGADSNAGAGIADTPIALATRRNRLDLVSLLLKNGADPNQCDFRQASPFAIAEEFDFFDIAAALKNSGLLDSPKPCKTYRRKTDFTEATIRLTDSSARLQRLFKSAINSWRKTNKGTSALSVGVSCSGVKGFVKVHISSKPSTPYAPDCFADLPIAKQTTIATWRNAFARKDWIYVEREERATKRLTNEAAFATRDQPFFAFVRDEFHKALKQGLFESISNASTTYGVQTYYFHHCCCWSSDKRKIARPKVWEATAQSVEREKRPLSDPISTSVEPLHSIKKSASEGVLADKVNEAWVLQNSRGIHLIPFGKKTGPRKDLAVVTFDSGGEFLLATVAPTELMLLQAEDGVLLNTIDLGEEVWRFQIAPIGKRRWILANQNEITLLTANRQGKLRKQTLHRTENAIANICVHPSGLVAFNEYYEYDVQVYRMSEPRDKRSPKLISMGKLQIEREDPNINAILNLNWHPNGFLLAVRYTTDEDDLLLLTDGSELNVTNKVFLGNDVLCGPSKWSTDGELLAMCIDGGEICITAGMLNSEDHLVLFDGTTLDILGALPVKDIGSYAWHPDELQLLVGGYKESTVWDCAQFAKSAVTV